MKTLKEVKDGDWISLVKLTGLKIKDIQGLISIEFGEPVFQLFRVVFEDGSFAFCEGEHDLPYLTDLDVSDEQLNNLSEE